MLQGLTVIGGFVLIGVAAYGFWLGLKLKPHDNIPSSKGAVGEHSAEGLAIIAR
jgi:hypothetical protein